MPEFWADWHQYGIFLSQITWHDMAVFTGYKINNCQMNANSSLLICLSRWSNKLIGYIQFKQFTHNSVTGPWTEWIANNGFVNIPPRYFQCGLDSQMALLSTNLGSVNATAKTLEDSSIPKCKASPTSLMGLHKRSTWRYLELLYSF